ncbi:MAG: hypothetical protein Q4A84_10820 [Neisseria sp.]|uniref:hypothetical protein n=1 Tax=Neisseria sp. TaxID=192066 RepID=UPI0026DB88CD|nr:hypothetical protein [Neisseria sp.]MDO4642171.1 hypothetical protein [Neisseria sp.]
MKKNIILAVPYLYGLDQCIEKNLRFHGFEVINLCYDDRDSFYPSLGTRLINVYQKHINKDGNYEKKLKFSRYQQDIRRKLSALPGGKADYALCIRANIYPKEIIATIREHSRVCVNYQWDGINRFPDILDYLAYFDRFFVFDGQDIQKYPQYGFRPTSNFYFDFPIKHKSVSDSLYFLGGYEANRERATEIFIETARSLKLPLDFNIYCKDDRAITIFGNDGINYLNRDTILNFEENIKKVQDAKAVVDFVNPDHAGCSFRIFDGLCFDKKVITTNAVVARYDFYHPNNILVWNGKESVDFIDFLQRPYQPIDLDIKNKYGFSNWIRYMLDIEPYTPINLP